MKRVILSGLMLMSFFFGAGNLIFAPVVGLESGENFFSALNGFNLTAVLIPFLTIIAVALSGDSALSLAGRVGKVYGFVFTVVIIFSIGPLFGIPRVANVSFDLGVKPLLGSLAGEDLQISSVFGLGYITLFFLLAYTLALYGEQLVNTIGKYLSPALVLFMVALVVVFAFSSHVDHIAQPTSKYADNAFLAGAFDGYGTLDAIAGVAFAGLIVDALKPDPNTSPKDVVSDVVKAGFVSVVLLAVIYYALAYLGNVTAESNESQGAGILVYASNVAFGAAGQYVFAVIVFLACITTAVGLLKTIASYSALLFGGLSENSYLLLFTLTSALLSVQGLSSVLKTSIPMIFLTYPITICLVIVTMLNKWTEDRAWVYFWVAVFVTPVAFADAFRMFSGNYFGESIDLIGFARPYVPFLDGDFSWVIPLLVGLVVGFLFPKKATNYYLLHDEPDHSYPLDKKRKPGFFARKANEEAVKNAK